MIIRLKKNNKNRHLLTSLDFGLNTRQKKLIRLLFLLYMYIFLFIYKYVLDVCTSIWVSDVRLTYIQLLHTYSGYYLQLTGLKGLRDTVTIHIHTSYLYSSKKKTQKKKE